MLGHDVNARDAKEERKRIGKQDRIYGQLGEPSLGATVPKAGVTGMSTIPYKRRQGMGSR